MAEYSRLAAEIKITAKLLAGWRVRKNWNNKRIVHKYKCIFIHIPKTAGNSVTSCLKTLGRKPSCYSPKIAKHAKAFEVKALLGQQIWDDYFTFSFVRNPWALMVSSYHWWLEKAPNTRRYRGHKNKIADFDSFESFMDSDYGRYQINERAGTFYDWLTDRSGNVLVDFIGRVENIQEDWAHICSKIGVSGMDIPHINTTSHKSYRDYYSAWTRKLVAERFAWAIDRFGYQF